MRVCVCVCVCECMPVLIYHVCVGGRQKEHVLCIYIVFLVLTLMWQRKMSISCI